MKLGFTEEIVTESLQVHPGIENKDKAIGYALQLKRQMTKDIRESQNFNL